MAGIPQGFVEEQINCSGTTLHVVHNGVPRSGKPLDDPRAPIVFLHGFPEFWIAWRSVFTELADRFLVIAPDQRGYNLSDAPAGVENYQARLLVADIASLVNQMIGQRPFILAGHDWGASIAYAIAMRFPQQVSHLVIANGVHPVCFQEALINDPAQARASSYFHLLRRQDAADIMAEDGFRRTFSMFEKFSATPWLDQATRAEYQTAWSQPGRLKTMLHWYSSSPIIVPEEVTDEIKPENAPLYGASRQDFRISMPHLLIWGGKDQALLSSATKDLGEFCDHLVRHDIADADHWLLHTHHKAIAQEITRFVTG